MSFSQPLTLQIPANTPVPLVLSSSHSGRLYPAGFNYSCPLSLLRQTEDAYVDELIGGAVDAGASVLTANFPRSYIDVNRQENDLDPAVLAAPWPTALAPSDRTLQGLGLVRRLCKTGVPMYHAPLSIADVQQRIQSCYRPYHADLQNLLTTTRLQFGEVYLLDCHSMPSTKMGGRTTADFVLGDRDGTSCDPAFTRLVHGLLADLIFNVALNHPYKGMEITRRYGLPNLRQNVLQIEINRGLYLDEPCVEKSPSFKSLQNALSKFFRQLVKELQQQPIEQLAAE